MRIDDQRKLELDCTKAINTSQEYYISQIIHQHSKFRSREVWKTGTFRSFGANLLELFKNP